MKTNKNKKIKNLGKPNFMPSALSDGIIWGPHRCSLAVLDHLRSSLWIICGRGLLASLYSTPRSRFSHTDLQLGDQLLGCFAVKHSFFGLIIVTCLHKVFFQFSN